VWTMVPAGNEERDLSKKLTLSGLILLYCFVLSKSPKSALLWNSFLFDAATFIESCIRFSNL
jgi:hypothetical protein